MKYKEHEAPGSIDVVALFITDCRRNFPNMTREEMVEAARLRDAGDKEALNRLVLQG